MKKIFSLFLLMVAALVGFQAQAAMWLVGDAFNGWSESGNVQMTQNGDIYSYEATLSAGKGFAFFKDTQGWSYQRGPNAGDNAAPSGDWEETKAGGAWKVATTGDYTIEYNYATDQAKIALKQAEAFDASQRKFAVTGAAFGAWNMPPADNQIFTNNGDGTYTLRYSGATAGQFKLAGVGINDAFDANWSVFNGGALGKSGLAEGDNALSTSFGDGNMTFPISGDVVLTINNVTESSCNLNIAVEQVIVLEPAYYLVGDFNNWGAEVPFVKNGDVFTLEQAFEQGGEFLIKDENGAWLGGVTDEEHYTLHKDWASCELATEAQGKKNFYIADAGDYTFTIENGVLTVSGFPEPQPVEPYATIYIDNINSTDGYLHAWDSAGDYTSWPGVQLSDLPTGEKDGNTYYKFEFTHDGGSNPSIIFSGDNDSKTEDIAVADGDVLKYLGEKSYLLNGVEYPTPLTITGVRLQGAVVDAIGDDWNDQIGIALAQDAETGVWSVADQAISAGYEFKVVVSYSDETESWLGASAQSGDWWITSVQLNTPLELRGSANFYFNEGGTFSFSYDPEDITLTVTGAFDEPQPVEPYATIYIDQSSAPGNFYAWDSVSNYFNDNWPGVEISSLEEAELNGTTYYVFHFTHDGGSQPSIIFSDNDGNKTDDIAVADGDILKYNGGSSYEFVTDEPVEPYATIYIDQSSAPGYLHAWDSAGDYTSWPGVQLSDLPTGEKDGNTYYKFEFTHDGGSQPVIIFSDDDGLQTDDIAVADGDILKYLGGEEYEKNKTDEPAEPAYYLIGSFNNWTEFDEDYKFVENEGVFTLADVQLAADTEFKILNQDGTYLGGQDGEQTYNVNSGWYENLPLESNKQQNFKLTEGGTLTFTIDNGVLTVSGFPEPQPVEHNYYLVGAFNEWGALGETPFIAGDNGYELTITFSGEFKIVEKQGEQLTWLTSNDGNYNITYGHTVITLAEGGVDDNLNIAEEAEYTLTIQNGVLTVTGLSAPENVIGVRLVGAVVDEIGDDWSGQISIDLTQDDQTGLWTVADQHIAAGFEFKVVIDYNDDQPSSWLGGNAEQGDFWITSQTLDTPIDLNGSANFYFNEGGTFSFSYDPGAIKLTVTGEFDEPQPVEPAYYLVGDFNNWNQYPEDEVIEFTENEGVWTATATLDAGNQFKVKDQDGIWYGGDTQSQGNIYELKATWPSAALTAGDAGSNFIINTAGEYTFTIENGMLTVSGWAGCTLAEALAGNNAPISDELTVVRVFNDKIYATDGNDNWVRLDDVYNVGGINEGDLIEGYQVSNVLNADIAPAIAVNDFLNFSEGQNLPELDEFDLRGGVDVMPKAGKVMTVKGYFLTQDGQPVFAAYSGKNGSQGNTIALAGANGMTEGQEYTIEVAIELLQPWEAESAGAPRRIKASDDNALSNIKANVIGEPVATGVNDIAVDGEVANVKYVNIAGQTSDKPFNGLNIVVTTYLDGTTKAVKVVR